MSLSGRSRVSNCSRRSLVGAASALPHLTSWPRRDASCWPRGSSGPKSRRSTSSDRGRSVSSNVTLSAPPMPCRSEQLSSRPTTIPRPWNSSRSIEFSLAPPRSRASESSGPSTTVSLNEHAAGDRTPGKAGGAPGPTRGGDTSWRWSAARAAQDARGAPRGVKRLGTRGVGRKARGSGGKCASRSAARNAYAAMQSEA